MSFMSLALLPPKAVSYCISPCPDSCFTGQQLECHTDGQAHRVTMWVADLLIVLVPAIIRLTERC